MYYVNEDNAQGWAHIQLQELEELLIKLEKLDQEQQERLLPKEKQDERE